jgi:N-acetylmuramoyl-L-alanine amidase
MKRIIQGILYALLIISMLLQAMVVVVLYQGIEDGQGMRFLVKKEAEEEPAVQEKKYRVVVKRLPVFGGADVAANAQGEAVSELWRGDAVLLLEEGGSYSRVRLEDGSEGYVWFDCIEELTDEEFLGKKDKVIVLDAGHQGAPNPDREPIGPGETDTKPKVASGTQGVVSGQPENQLNLTISLLVEALLEEQGYTAVMIRRTAEVNVSNVERAMVANRIEADAFIRIHADGSENPEASGSMTIISTSESKYDVVRYYEESKRLAAAVLNAYTQATGFHRKEIWERDNYSGINWCTVPVTILEMGYMTNREEDQKMQDPQMQQKMAEGITQGVINYLEYSYVE